MADVYSLVTDRILEALDNGVAVWTQPWSVDAHKNMNSGRNYRGINQLLCQMYMDANSYEHNLWLTYKGAQKLEGNVKKGEKSHIVVLWKWIKKEAPEDAIDDEPITFPILRYYSVFNVDQCEGIEVPVLEARQINPNEEAEKVIAEYEDGPEITFGGSGAWYAPKKDVVNVPVQKSFVDDDAYYATLFHELGHSTGHESRLNRKGIMDTIRFGSEDYSQEELCAEICAAMLGAKTGIDPSTVDRAASYIDNWRKKLGEERKWIVNAAAQAQKAADYILGVTYEEEESSSSESEEEKGTAKASSSS